MTLILIELPTHLVAHLQNRTSQHTSQVLQKSHQANAPKPTRNDNKTDDRKRRVKADQTKEEKKTIKTPRATHNGLRKITRL